MSPYPPTDVRPWQSSFVHTMHEVTKSLFSLIRWHRLVLFPGTTDKFSFPLLILNIYSIKYQRNVWVGSPGCLPQLLRNLSKCLKIFEPQWLLRLPHFAPCKFKQKLVICMQTDKYLVPSCLSQELFPRIWMGAKYPFWGTLTARLRLRSKIYDSVHTGLAW